MMTHCDGSNHYDDDQLADRFGWWWRDLATALRRVFPQKSSYEDVRKFVWPEIEHAAFYYELASRRGRRTKYLLGKQFDLLTVNQIGDLVGLWPRKWKPLQPVFILPEAKKDDWSPWIEWAVGRGWTAPSYFLVNLAECGDTAICEAFRKHVATERERLKIPSPKPNQRRANRSAKGLSFRKIEALDVWTHLPRHEAKLTEYDDAEARSARRQAKVLFRRWTKRPGKTKRRGKSKEIKSNT